jgi:AraC-like DNA-binding protein
MKKYLTTSGLIDNAKFDYWQDIVNEHFVKLTCRPGISNKYKQFDANLSCNKLSCLGLLEVCASAQSVTRSPKRFSEDDYLLLTLQKKGSMEITQDGRRTVLSPGDIGVYDSRRPYFINLKNEFHMQTLKIPFDVLDINNYKTDTITAKKIVTCTPINFIFSSLMSNLFSMNEPTDYLEGKEVFDLFNTGLNKFISHNSGVKFDGYNTDVNIDLHRVRDFIQSNLSHPSMSVDLICKELGISRSSLYRIFSSEGGNISNYIWRQRVYKLKVLLESNAYYKKTITELAFGVGFSSSSHASVLFKDYVGMTPSQYRRSLKK